MHWPSLKAHACAHIPATRYRHAQMNVSRRYIYAELLTHMKISFSVFSLSVKPSIWNKEPPRGLETSIMQPTYANSSSFPNGEHIRALDNWSISPGTYLRSVNRHRVYCLKRKRSGKSTLQPTENHGVNNDTTNRRHWNYNILKDFQQ